MQLQTIFPESNKLVISDTCFQSENSENNKKTKEIFVSFGNKVKNTSLTLKTLDEIINMIKSNENMATYIRRIRQAKDEEDQKKLKCDLLPYFNLGHFEPTIRVAANLKNTEYLLFDADYLENVQVILDRIKADPRIFLAFISARGNGIKFALKVNEPITDHKKFSEIYSVVREQLENEFSIELDKTSDACRACFLSHDPDVYVNLDSKPINISKIRDFKQKVIKKVAKSLKRKEILNALSPQTPGGRTGAMTKIVGQYIDRGFDREFTLAYLKNWNKENTPPLPEDKLISTVDDMFVRYNKGSNHLPLKIISRDNCYFKSLKKKNSEEIMLSSFTIEPKELLVLESSDCLKCDIKSAGGFKYPNILIENTDWHTKGKFLKSIGHQDCVFLGSDNDLQVLCNHINSNIPIRKKGTKVIGLIDDRWVIKDLNITKNGKETENIVPFEKGADAFYNKIKYNIISENEYNQFLKSFYENILKINDPNIIPSWLGWSFATVVKPQIIEKTGSFPMAFVHGGQGSGKTTTGMLFSRLFGYTDPKPYSCTMRSFPMLKLLSSTNAIPVFLDEYKEQDMRDDQVDSILRYMRKLYSGEIESKGRPDLSVEDYKLTAPTVIMGEWSITQPAIKERIVMIRFSNVIKSDMNMQCAYGIINNLPLESFMPEYIKFCLNQDISDLYHNAKDIVEQHFINITVAPRIKHNLSCMVLGIELFKMYGESKGLTVPPVGTNLVLDYQLKEITGTNNGFVKSAVDQLIEELAIMAGKGKIKPGTDFKFVKTNDRNSNSTELLAIKFNQVFPEFKMWAKQTSYEGDVLDKESYVKLFDDCEYITNKNFTVRFDKKTAKALCIDYKKAESAGLNLDGFEREDSRILESVTSVTDSNQTSVTELTEKTQ